MSSSDYLTNLSRSELADKLQEIASLFRRRELDAFEDMDALQVAASSLRELDQRDERIEALSAQVRAADKRALAAERETALVRGNLERERDHLREQIDKLASFILSEVPGEPSENQGAVDTAVRVIRNLQARVADLERDNAEGAAKLGARRARIANLESELAMWKHSDAQARRDWNADKACASQVIDVFGELTEMHTPQEAAEEVKRKLLDAMARVAELEAQLEAEMRKPITVLSMDGQAEIDRLRAECCDLYADRERLLRKSSSFREARKVQEEWRYGPHQLTLSAAVAAHGNTRTLEDVADQLRETLATLDAVRALAEEFSRYQDWLDLIGSAIETNQPIPTKFSGRRFDCLRSCLDSLREVLNGKR